MNAHWLLAVGFAGMAVAIFFLGWSARIMRVEWRDDKALRAAEARYERHTHRKGDPQPAALSPFPGEPVAGVGYVQGQGWRFVGESEQGWATEAAEYELLTQTAVQPASSVEGEPPIDTGEIMAITDRVESWIAQWTAQGNVDRHTIQAGD